MWQLITKAGEKAVISVMEGSREDLGWMEKQRSSVPSFSWLDQVSLGDYVLVFSFKVRSHQDAENSSPYIWLKWRIAQFYVTLLVLLLVESEQWYLLGKENQEKK